MRGTVVHASAALLLGGCLGEPPAVGGNSTEMGTTNAASSSGPSDPDSTGNLPQAPACASYLECVAEVVPEQLPAAQARYGPDGSCWIDPTSATQCEAMCTTEADALCPEGTGSETGEPPPLLCSIEGLLPGTPSPVEVGRGPELLPVEIGEVLDNNCGCHLIDPRTLDPEVPAYFGAIRLSTWTDFHTPFMGSPAWQRVQQRTVVELGMPPAYFCDDLDFGSLSAVDHALLSAWLDAGAPDAVRWGGS